MKKSVQKFLPILFAILFASLLTLGSIFQMDQFDEDVLSTRMGYTRPECGSSDLISFSTFIGGAGSDYAYSVNTDTIGNIYIVGETTGLFPTTNGAYQETHNGGRDIFVAKFTPDGSQLLFSTYLGGTADDFIATSEFDSNGDLIIAGYTRSSNFPTTSNGFDVTPNGGRDGFVAKLSKNGSQLLYSSYIGGSGDDYLTDFALDSVGNLILVGYTTSINFPTTSGAFNRTYTNNTDGFVAKLSANGAQLLYSTYLGGNSTDYIRSVAVDIDGCAYVTGNTFSDDFPGINVTRAGDSDIFVAKLDTTGSSLIYSTLLGGVASDIAYGIAVDSQKHAYITGTTYSPDFPITSGAFRILQQGAESFITKLSVSGESLLYSTFIGCTGNDFGASITVIGTHAYILGHTYSPNFITTPSGIQRLYSGGYDSFLVKMGTNGTQVLYSTFFGGSSHDYATAFTINSNNQTVLVGYTLSSNIPLKNAYQLTNGGSYDAFIVKFTLDAIPESILPAVDETPADDIPNDGETPNDDETPTDDEENPFDFLLNIPSDILKSVLIGVGVVIIIILIKKSQIKVRMN